MRVNRFCRFAAGLAALATIAPFPGVADPAPLIRGAYFDTAIRPEYFGSNHLPARTNAPVIIPAVTIVRAGAPPVKIPATRFEVSIADAKLWAKGLTLWADVDVANGTGTIVTDSLDSARYGTSHSVLVARYKQEAGLAAVIPVAESVEEQMQTIRQARNHQTRHAGVTALMADKLMALGQTPEFLVEARRGKEYLSRHPPRQGAKLFRILVLGDSLLTAVDGLVRTPDGNGWMVNSNAISKLGVDEAPPFLEYRNVPSVFYELMAAQTFSWSGKSWQGDIEFRRFSHPDFKYTGTWESSQLIEGKFPEWEKLGLPRFFDYRSPAEAGDAMEIAIEGKRYVNVVYAKRFDSGSFSIEVDGLKEREVNGAEGLKFDNKVSTSKIYSVNDVVDCREWIDLGDTRKHLLRLVAADVSKPVRIWGIEMWNTPSFIVMNGGKSGLNVNHFVGVLGSAGQFLQPDIVVLEVSGNDLPYQVRENLNAYAAIVNQCRRAGVPIVFAIPPLSNYTPFWKDTMNNVRALLDGLNIPYIDVQKQLILEAEASGLPLDVYQKEDGHPNIPGIELFARELLLPFLNAPEVQAELFKGDTSWGN